MTDWLMDGRIEEQSRSATWPCVLVFLTEAALHLGDTELAAQLRPHVAELSGSNIVMGPMAAVFGAADRYLGMIDSALDRSAADDLLAAAVELDRRMDAPLFLAYSLAARLAHLRASGVTAPWVAELQAEATDLVTGLQVPRLTRTLAAATWAAPEHAPRGGPGLGAGIPSGDVPA